jgi:hypothetical protein
MVDWNLGWSALPESKEKSQHTLNEKTNISDGYALALFGLYK